ncbi:hypothetical protein BJ878DRAFT_214128 [Calycina marina]|uniref:Uncharacterized protein n=1 Tax=Calycina marina TaxID=1763456 RepID=A0A9P7Z8F4_9HELO|nr:hypothetical protein BJ878DRAFT_214128 [Calycina marina]
MYFSFSPSPPSTNYTMPMDIPSKSNARPQSPSSACAFPSWPRRSSLSSSDGKQEMHPSSYISDDDLEDLFPNVFDDRSQDYTPVITPSRTPDPQVVIDLRELMGDLVAQEKARKVQRTRRRSGSSSSKKSRSSSGGSSKPMTPIQEVGE